MEIGRSLRTARAAVFAAVCVGVSAAGHVWMMPGTAIPAWALCVAVFAVAGAGYALAGRQRGFASIAPLMLVGQLGLHLLFSAAQSTTRGAATPMPWMPDVSRIRTPRPMSASAWLCGGGGMTAHESAGMITGMVAVHAAAGLLCAWWLHHGEAAAFRLLHTLALLALPLLTLILPTALSVPDLTAADGSAGSREPAPSGPVLLVHAVVRRGPPTPLLSM
jgi:hypothetical protein